MQGWSGCISLPLLPSRLPRQNLLKTSGWVDQNLLSATKLLFWAVRVEGEIGGTMMTPSL